MPSFQWMFPGKIEVSSEALLNQAQETTIPPFNSMALWTMGASSLLTSNILGLLIYIKTIWVLHVRKNKLWFCCFQRKRWHNDTRTQRWKLAHQTPLTPNERHTRQMKAYKCSNLLIGQLGKAICILKAEKSVCWFVSKSKTCFPTFLKWQTNQI